MRQAVFGFAGTQSLALKLMNVFERHGASIVAITESPCKHDIDRFKVFGFVEEQSQADAIAKEIDKLRQGA
jgi:hypothetical protein